MNIPFSLKSSRTHPNTIPFSKGFPFIVCQQKTRQALLTCPRIPVSITGFCFLFSHVTNTHRAILKNKMFFCCLVLLNKLTFNFYGSKTTDWTKPEIFVVFGQVKVKNCLFRCEAVNLRNSIEQY